VRRRLKKRARVKRKITEGLVERRNVKRLAERTKAKAVIKKRLTLRHEGWGSKED